MKFSFGCLSAVLVPVVAIANEIEQQSVPTSTVISDKYSKSSNENENLRSRSSPFSKVKETNAYKNLSHRTAVRYEPTKMQNSKPFADDAHAHADGDDNVDVKVNKMEAAGTTMAVSAAGTTTVAANGEEVCVPPVTVTKFKNLDAGNLPLSSCSSKKQICINNNKKKESSTSSSSVKKQTGVCLDPWAIPSTYMDNSDPNSEDVPSTYWGDLSSTGIAATYFAQKEDADHPYATERHLQVTDYCLETCGSYRPEVENFYLQDAIKYCYDNDDTTNCPYPSAVIQCWDVSAVTYMDLAFYEQSTFNQPLKCWDTSSANYMNNMFLDAYEFNQDINSWDTSKVQYMYSMFQRASLFNSPLDSWNVGKVTYMQYMFNEASKFNQPIGVWDTSKVQYMNYMFQSASLFNSPLETFNVKKVIEMDYMFSFSSFNQPLNDWNLGKKLESMSGMFYNASR